MGTDIHSIVQVRKNGVWTKAPIEAYGDRDYTAFAIIGNVRNGYGFAGCYRHDPIPFIQEGRGLPDGVVNKYDHPGDDDDLVWFGDHSFGYVSLRELLEYDWTKTIKQGGLLKLAEYVGWDKTSQPESYCGGVGGPGVRVLTPQEADQNAVLPADHSKLYVQCTWEQPIGKAVKYFMEWVNELKEYAFANDINPDDVRFVFGFDS